MIKKNDTTNAPLRFEIGNLTIGEFYNSWDKKYHLAEYIPYNKPPRNYLCKYKPANFSASRSENDICEECLAQLKVLSKLSDEDFDKVLKK